MRKDQKPTFEGTPVVKLFSDFGGLVSLSFQNEGKQLSKL